MTIVETVLGGLIIVVGDGVGVVGLFVVVGVVAAVEGLVIAGVVTGIVAGVDELLLKAYVVGLSIAALSHKPPLIVPIIK